MKKVILIQKKDIKSSNWAKIAKDYDIDLIPQIGSPIKAPLFLIKFFLKNGRPKGYIVRYLNDYNSFVKTIVRFFSEILLILLCKLFKVELYWICHNVDKESGRNFPSLSNFRRNMFARFSKKIFVTDKLLIEFAKKKFSIHAKKIDNITFGTLEGSSTVDKNVELEAIEFIENLSSNNKNILVTLCTGAPAEKSLHFDYLETLIEKSNNFGLEIIAIVAGDFLFSERGKAFYLKYNENPNIIVFSKYTKFSKAFINKYIDFYFRGYGDYSVPFTVYEAASYKKPILALKSCFLPDLVQRNKLGSIVEKDFKNIKNAIENLLTIKEENYIKFLCSHQWKTLGEKLINEK